MLKQIEMAIKFAENGYHVFPLYKSNKGPLKPYGWAKNSVSEADVDDSKIIPASNDVEYVKSWPKLVKDGYNSIVVGYGVMGTGCVIFDLDVKDGKDGLRKFKELAKRHEIPRPDFIVKTKSGGFHFYYGRPEKFKNAHVKSIANVSFAGVKYTGVDVRGNGGMVIGPSGYCEESEWQPGEYSIIYGDPTSELSILPEKIIGGLLSAKFTNAAENLIIDANDGEDDAKVLAILKRGEIPRKLPNGFRNQGFYIFINALRNKGFSQSTVRSYAMQLKAVTEDLATFDESINIDEIIGRVFAVDVNNPFDVAHDLLNCGLYRVTGSGKIRYTCIDYNPYFASQNQHDLQAMRQLLKKYERTMTKANGKEARVNPAELLDGLMDQTNEVDAISYKPGAGTVFASNGDGGRRFLNSWNDVRLMIRNDDYDDEAYEQFKFIVSRIFGPEGSDEFQLGLDLPAWVIQRPGVKPSIVPFVQSFNRGVGKSCYMNSLRHVMGHNKIGDNQARTVKLEEISGRFFNPSGSSLLMLDEVQFATHRNMRQESTSFWKHLKTLVTSPTVSVEIKGGGTFEMPNVSGMLMAGNSNNHFPIEENDRRIWLIDNNPQILTLGLADMLFELDKSEVSDARKAKISNSIRRRLATHKIKIPLDTIRAPMNDVKRDMYLHSLTDIEEWFITHFENTDNICAASPVITKEMLIYTIQTSDKLANSRWRESPEETIRELRKRGMIMTIKSLSSATLTRQISGFPNISLVSYDQIVDTAKASVFTTREHGSFNASSNELIKQCLKQNCASIVDWKTKSIRHKASVL